MYLERRLLKKLDIYVSLNKYRNLSNTNLEAISSEKAMIILNSDLKTKTEIFLLIYLAFTLTKMKMKNQFYFIQRIFR